MGDPRDSDSNSPTKKGYEPIPGKDENHTLTASDVDTDENRLSRYFWREIKDFCGKGKHSS